MSIEITEIKWEYEAFRQKLEDLISEGMKTLLNELTEKGVPAQMAEVAVLTALAALSKDLHQIFDSISAGVAEGVKNSEEESNNNSTVN